MKPHFKHFIVFFITSALIVFSCNKPNLDGHWHVYDVPDRGEFYIWDIKSDTIIDNHRGTLTGNNFKVYDDYEINFYEDSAYLFQNDTLKLILKKKENCKLYEHEVELKIKLNLPEFEIDEIELYDEDEFLWNDIPIYTGKPNNEIGNKYIQLNDRLVDLGKVRPFLSFTNYEEDRYRVMLLCDKGIKMGLVNKILYEIRTSSFLRFGYVLGITNTSNIGIIGKLYSAIGDEEFHYYPNYKNDSIFSMPPPSLPWFSIFNAINKEAFKFNLKNDSLFCNQKPIGQAELKDTLSKYFSSFNFQQKEVNVVFEWDTASVFNTYAQVSVLLDNVKKNYRNEVALQKHKQSFKKLGEKERMELMKQYRVNIIEITPADRCAIDKKNNYHR